VTIISGYRAGGHDEPDELRENNRGRLVEFSDHDLNSRIAGPFHLRPKLGDEWMITALIAAAVATSPPAAPVAEAPVSDARPALWVVNDEDTVIYLFGTFHALDGKSAWFNDEVKTAFNRSQELILETLVPDLGAPPAPAPAPGFRIQPVGPFAGSASFLTTSKTVMSAGRSQGMSTAKGADAILREAAEHVGKPVGGLESFQFQLNMFSKLPGATPPKDPAAATNAKVHLAAVLTQLQAAWNQGEIERFAPMLDQMRTKSPETYKLLFTDRNGRWAAWIAHRLQQPGVVFVAVGAGHLAGEDSVQKKLAALHVRSQRIN
jgi:uncharacterized protein YbaP (TraB family)